MVWEDSWSPTGAVRESSWRIGRFWSGGTGTSTESAYYLAKFRIARYAFLRLLQNHQPNVMKPLDNSGDRAALVLADLAGVRSRYRDDMVFPVTADELAWLQPVWNGARLTRPGRRSRAIVHGSRRLRFEEPCDDGLRA